MCTFSNKSPSSNKCLTLVTKLLLKWQSKWVQVHEVRGQCQGMCTFRGHNEYAWGQRLGCDVRGQDAIEDYTGPGIDLWPHAFSVHKTLRGCATNQNQPPGISMTPYFMQTLVYEWVYQNQTWVISPPRLGHPLHPPSPHVDLCAVHICGCSDVCYVVTSITIWTPGGGPLVFQAGYHPRKRIFKTHPKHVFFRYESRP